MTTYKKTSIFCKFRTINPTTGEYECTLGPDSEGRPCGYAHTIYDFTPSNCFFTTCNDNNFECGHRHGEESKYVIADRLGKLSPGEKVRWQIAENGIKMKYRKMVSQVMFQKMNIGDYLIKSNIMNFTF